MGVAEYQVVIFVVVMPATAAMGTVGLWVAGGAAVLWTLVIVFSKELMALQLGTIVVAVLVGVVLRMAGMYLVAIVVIAAITWFVLGKGRSVLPTAVPAAQEQSAPGPSTLGERRVEMNPACRFVRGVPSCPAGQPAFFPWTDEDYRIAGIPRP